MKSITETEVEEFAIELFQNSGYDYLNGPEIAPDGSYPEWGSSGDVILVNRLHHAIEKLNPEILFPARELADRVRKNTTIDWTIKENVRARLRVMVKRTLRKYGYPPDKQRQATETVIQQAEMLAGGAEL